MMTFHPGRGVGDLGEAGGMTFRKTVAAEALDLLECASGEVSSVAAFDHSADHFVFKMGDASGGLERGNGTPELVGLGRRESGADDTHPHCLLLDMRHSPRSETPTSDIQSQTPTTYAVI